jgi:hypothetical protein
MAMERHMVLAKKGLLDFVFAPKARKKKRRAMENDEFDLREHLRLQDELKAAREKARLFDVLHRNRVY